MYPRRDMSSERRRSPVELALAMARFIGLMGFLGGLAALTGLWMFGPQPGDHHEWRMMVEVMRSIFYPCVFAGIVVLVLSGGTIWWKRRKTLNRQKWFRVMMAIIVVAVPTLHLWARFTMLKLLAAVEAERLDEAAALWDGLGKAYLTALIVFVLVSMIGIAKPRLA